MGGVSLAHSHGDSSPHIILVRARAQGGKGGRNQEIALAAAREISGQRGMVVLSAGTDGTDGPTDAAGAVCDGGTLARARAKGLDVDAFLANNDAYNFFAQLGDGLLITGPTGTNVADVAFLLVGAAE
jgi:glycerate 2-kinase